MTETSTRFSDSELLQILSLSQNATAIYRTEEIIIETASDTMIAFWGKNRTVIGMPMEQAVPELKGQPFVGILKEVWCTGVTYEAEGMPAQLLINGTLQTFYFDFVYRAVKSEDGSMYCILHTAVNVTERVMNAALLQHAEQQQKALEQELMLNKELVSANEELQETQKHLHKLNEGLEERVSIRTSELMNAENHLRSVLDQAPLALCILSGKDLVIEFANDRMLALWNKDKSVIGKQHAHVRSEPEAAPFLAVLREVFATGIPFTGTEVKAYTAGSNRSEWGYFNFSYQPVRDNQGTITGILAILDDVTKNITIRKETERINMQLRLAVKAARIGTWYIVPDTKALEYDSVLADIFGYEGEKPMTYEQAIAQVTQEYRVHITKAIDTAIKEGSYYDITYSQRRFNNNEVIWLRSLGRIMQDEKGDFTVFSGVVLDVTEQVETRNALQSVNEKLAAINDELAGANEEQTRINEELLQVQDNLQIVNNQLIQSDMLLRLGIEAANMGYWHIQPRTKSIDYSANLEKIFGFEGDGGMQYDAIFAQILEEYQVSLAAHIQDAVENNKDYDVTYAQRRFNDGEIIWLRSVGKVIKNSTGDNPVLSGMIIDVSEQVTFTRSIQKLNEDLAAANEQQTDINEELLNSRDRLSVLNDQLIQSEYKFRTLIKNAPVGISIFNTRKLIVEVANEKMLEIWGRQEADIGIPLIDMMPELEDQPFLQILDDVFTTGKPFYGNESKAVIVRNGKREEGWFNLIFQPIADDNGNTTSILQVAVDVTEQVKIRKQIEEAEESLRIATEAAELGTWSFYPDTNELVTSNRLKGIFGVSPDELMNQQMKISQIHPDYKEYALGAVQECVATGNALNIEYPITEHKEGRQRWVREAGKLIEDQRHAGKYLTGVLADITEQKQDEQRKNDFIGMVSHELKTPLTSMNGFLQLLQMKSDTEDGFTLNMLDKAKKQVSKMTTLINGFLNVARLESGKIQIDKQRFDMAMLIKEAEEDAISLYNNHKIVFAPVEETFVMADRDKISQVINNLISNAVKYSPANTVIHVACATIQGCATVMVKDNGIGIRPADQEKLFTRYYRVNNGSASSVSGFGIGLYLCYEIIQRHDGKIRVESEVGKGSTFSFSLPVVS